MVYYANLSEANLTHASLSFNVYLNSVNLSNANLTGANLLGVCSLRNANLTGANLTGTLSAKVEESVMADAFQEACQFGLSAIDALHVAAALSVNAEELITTEKPSKPIHRVTKINLSPHLSFASD